MLYNRFSTKKIIYIYLIFEEGSLHDFVIFTVYIFKVDFISLCLFSLYLIAKEFFVNRNPFGYVFFLKTQKTEVPVSIGLLRYFDLPETLKHDSSLQKSS